MFLEHSPCPSSIRVVDPRTWFGKAGLAIFLIIYFYFICIAVLTAFLTFDCIWGACTHVCVPVDLRLTSELSLQYSPLYVLRQGLSIGPELKCMASQSSQLVPVAPFASFCASLTCGMLHPPGIYAVLGI